MEEQRVEIAGRTWQLGIEIGAGGFGSVRVAESDGTQAAIKFVPKAPGAERELLLVDLPGVPNVVPVLATGETDAEWLLLMPLAKGSLRQHL